MELTVLAIALAVYGFFGLSVLKMLKVKEGAGLLDSIVNEFARMFIELFVKSFLAVTSIVSFAVSFFILVRQVGTLFMPELGDLMMALIWILLGYIAIRMIFMALDALIPKEMFKWK